MKVVIFCGGFGLRMRSGVDSAPKPDAKVEAAGHPTLYASGEESPLQIKLRADRLGEDAGDVTLLSETIL